MPKLRRKLENNHTLKKQPYLILLALRELEKNQGLGVVTSAPMMRGVPAGAALLQHLETVLGAALVGIPNAPGEVAHYLRLLTKYTTMAKQALATNTTANRATLTAVLTAHTKAFNALNAAKINLTINQAEWIDVILCTIAIWGDTPPIR